VSLDIWCYIRYDDQDQNVSGYYIVRENSLQNIKLQLNYKFFYWKLILLLILPLKIHIDTSLGKYFSTVSPKSMLTCIDTNIR